MHNVYHRNNIIGTVNIIQITPKGEVNSGGYIYRDAKRRGTVYIHSSSPTLRGIIVLVFTKADG